MKIIGIDIAIENLAFCGGIVKEDGSGLDIIKDEWFVLDTTPEDYKQVCIYENKKKCSKDAGWFYIEKESNLYQFYCASHKKIIDKEGKHTWKTLNKNYLNSNEVIQSMFKKLDEHIEFFRSANYIVIEKQPPKNPKMIAIMNYLYSYFVIRLWNDVEKSKCNLKDIIFVDAKNKVNYCLGILEKTKKEEIEKKHDPKKNKYQYYKKISIAGVQQELANEKELLDYFNSYKKIDDLADSRNMILWWIAKNKKLFTNEIPIKKEKVTRTKKTKDL